MSKLVEFQQKYNLTPDGLLGPNTLRKMKVVFSFDSNEKLAHFIGQIAHETGNFRFTEENLKYSPDTLRRVFSNYFKSYAEAMEFAYNPEKIANRVYANRMGNGDEASGDGYKFRGRGAIQLTGRNNYTIFAGKMYDRSILTNPGLVATKYYFESALFYFTQNRLWNLCNKVDNESIVELTKRINGGTNGLQDRIEKTKFYYKMLNNSSL
jgi:putative chitinase